MSTPRVSIRAVVSALGICVAPLSAQEQFVYVRKESREASRQASLAASGQAVWPGDWHVIYFAVILGMAAVLLFSFVVLRAASRMVRFLGPGGIDAMTRIFGFLLICIGMQFLLTGISDFFGLAHG